MTRLLETVFWILVIMSLISLFKGDFGGNPTQDAQHEYQQAASVRESLSE